jgi:pilus assembly protein Flp/PilA
MLKLENKTQSPMSRNSERPAPDSMPSRMATLSTRAAGDEEGGTAIEYALIASGIGAAVAATVYSLGTSVANLYQTIANLL